MESGNRTHFQLSTSLKVLAVALFDDGNVEGALVHIQEAREIKEANQRAIMRRLLSSILSHTPGRLNPIERLPSFFKTERAVWTVTSTLCSDKLILWAQRPGGASTAARLMVSRVPRNECLGP